MGQTPTNFGQTDTGPTNVANFGQYQHCQDRFSLGPAPSLDPRPLFGPPQFFLLVEELFLPLDRPFPSGPPLPLDWPHGQLVFSFSCWLLVCSWHCGGVSKPPPPSFSLTRPKPIDRLSFPRRTPSGHQTGQCQELRSIWEGRRKAPREKGPSAATLAFDLHVIEEPSTGSSASVSMAGNVAGWMGCAKRLGPFFGAP